MKQWMQEDWEFQLTVVRGESRHCRLGLEAGDVFTFQYACPAGFCPKSMGQLHTLCEIARCGGDFRLRGSDSAHEIRFSCADNVLEFSLIARHIDT